MSKPKLLSFRKEAVVELNMPKQLDQLIQVISPRAWLILGASYLLLFSVIAWGIFGTIPTRVEGQGVLLAENGSVYNAVAAAGGGRVVKILVKEGDRVQKKDILAELERPDLVEKLGLSLSYVKRLKEEITELKQASERDANSRLHDIQHQRAILENNITVEAKNLDDAQKLLELKESYFKRGLIALQDLETIRRDFHASKQKIDQTNMQIAQLKTQEADFKDQWYQRINEKEALLLTEELKAENLRAELETCKTVTSPTDGIVVSINAILGKRVEEGGSVASIASLGKGLDVIVFMKPQNGQRVNQDMKALVTPKIIEKEQYGSMRGTVLRVSSFPETSEAITAIRHNPELTKEFVEKGAPTAIRVRIQRDPDTFSGYLWSSSKGPQAKVMPGMLADVRITVREQAPFSLIIPMFKKLLGVS